MERIVDRVFDRLERIQQLWKELERTRWNTSEYEALMKKIRVLSEEFKAFVDGPTKPRETNRATNELSRRSEKRNPDSISV